MHRIFSGDGQLGFLDIREPARDYRRSQPLVQQPLVVFILCILCIDVSFLLFNMDAQDLQDCRLQLPRPNCGHPASRFARLSFLCSNVLTKSSSVYAHPL